MIGENVNRLLVVIAVALSSLAQAQPTLTPHPIEVLTRGVSKAQLEALQNEYRRVLIGQVTMPSNRAILQAVVDLKRQDCGVSDDCLKKLAVLGGSLYAMHVSGTQDPGGNALMVARVVRDDGKGLDLDAIRRKAFAMGMVQEDQPMSPEQLAQLVFASGFSTAAEVTEISGRGVGMDAVKGFVEREGGTIELQFIGEDKGTGLRAFETVISLPEKFAVHLDAQ